MTNFAFLAATGWPESHADCTREENYLESDPRSACFYARRAAEQLVEHLYDVLGLPIPYQDDLSARINDAAFRATAGMGIPSRSST